MRLPKVVHRVGLRQLYTLNLDNIHTQCIFTISLATYLHFGKMGFNRF